MDYPYYQVSGYDENNPGDPIVRVAFECQFQAGQEAEDTFVASVKNAVGGQPNVTSVKATKFEVTSATV